MTYEMKTIPKVKHRIMRSGYGNQNPCGVHVIGGCLPHASVKDCIFSGMSRPSLDALESISSLAAYPKNAILFVEGQDTRGVFVLRNGRVKLSTTSADGESIIVYMAEAGEIVGLAGTLSGNPCELTAEAMEPIQADFIPRAAFLHFLKQNGDAAVRVAEILSKIYHSTLLEVRFLGFFSSAAEKFARFLLDLPTRSSDEKDNRATLTLTHREIGETIGASRETVTRLFANFKREGLIEVHGPTVVFLDRNKLEKVIPG